MVIELWNVRVQLLVRLSKKPTAKNSKKMQTFYAELTHHQLPQDRLLADRLLADRLLTPLSMASVKTFLPYQCKSMEFIIYHIISRCCQGPSKFHQPLMAPLCVSRIFCHIER